MAEADAPFIDGPIAGQSLTFELGNRPWQQPPQYTTVEETLEYYIPRFLDSDISEQLIDVIEMGVPLTTIANAMQTGGVMEGLHSLDVGIVITPALVEVISQMATQAEVDFKQQTEVEKDTMNDSEIKSILREIEDVPYPTPEPKGLMARRAM